MSLQGKIGLVTGGGSGIGETSAKQLAARGARIVVADANEADAERVAGEIGNNGGYASAFKCDISVLDEVERMVAYTVRTYGALNIAWVIARSWALKRAGAESDFGSLMLSYKSR